MKLYFICFILNLWHAKDALGHILFKNIFLFKALHKMFVHMNTAHGHIH